MVAFYACNTSGLSNDDAKTVLRLIMLALPRGTLVCTFASALSILNRRVIKWAFESWRCFASALIERHIRLKKMVSSTRQTIKPFVDHSSVPQRVCIFDVVSRMAVSCNGVAGIVLASWLGISVSRQLNAPIDQPARIATASASTKASFEDRDVADQQRSAE